MKRFSSFNLTALLLMSSFLHLASPSLAAGGSHPKVRICARFEYSYKDGDGRIVSGSTPEECGSKYLKTHHPTAEKEASRKEACDAARQHLPKLKQGENWINRVCKDYETRRA